MSATDGSQADKLSDGAATFQDADVRPSEGGGQTSVFSNVWRYLDRPKVSRVLAALLGIASVAAGAATYVVFTGTNESLEADPDRLVLLIYLDLVLFLLFSVIIARRLVRLWSERRQGAAGAKMHVRLAAMFGILSIAPAIIVAGFSLLFFNFGLESWFSDKVRTAISSSEAVAESYLEEHLRNIEADALFIASNINRDAGVLTSNIQLMERVLNFSAVNRGLSEVLVFEDNGRILGRAGITIVLEFEPISNDAKNRARSGEVVIIRSDADDRVRALVRLDNIIDTYLIVGRAIDSAVLEHVEETQGAALQFKRLEEERSRFQISFALAFVMVALLLLLTAVWIGLTVATGLSEPISRLIAATEQVRGGNLNTLVQTSSRDDEVDTLGRAFNRMTDQLRSQRNELLQANEQIDQRRRFTETVLTGVSAGVIGLDREGQIELPNNRASELLGIPLDQYISHPIRTVVPEMADVISRALIFGPDDFIEEEIRIERDGGPRALVLRIGALRQIGEVTGYVMTLDDITDLASAQRKAAWADVARRIAHEIKNPLTPIQLSAERLKRKYLKDIDNDPQVFETCVDTIIRQVGDIGRMVDEFSSFARMPAPKMQETDMNDLVRQQVFLQRNANADIGYDMQLPEDPAIWVCDNRQIAQVLTNVLQNAKDAIDGRSDRLEEPGEIKVALTVTDHDLAISVQDNGRGLPTTDRHRLTEPYVTTREKGTGLGLAIVKKIMEDHAGSIMLMDTDTGGAEVVLRFGKMAQSEFKESALLAEDDDVVGRA